MASQGAFDAQNAARFLNQSGAAALIKQHIDESVVTVKQELRVLTQGHEAEVSMLANAVTELKKQNDLLTAQNAAIQALYSRNMDEIVLLRKQVNVGKDMYDAARKGVNVFRKLYNSEKFRTALLQAEKEKADNERLMIIEKITSLEADKASSPGDSRDGTATGQGSQTSQSAVASEMDRVKTILESHHQQFESLTVDRETMRSNQQQLGENNQMLADIVEAHQDLAEKMAKMSLAMYASGQASDTVLGEADGQGEL